MRAEIALLCLGAFMSGCTADMLDRHTVNQAMSVTDMRYQEVMDNLAVVAHNTGMLPSFALNGGGTPTVTNLVSADPKTTWDPVGFMSQTLNVVGKNNPQVIWNFEAVASNIQLAALRYACIWAACGPEHVDADGIEYLRAPRRSDVFPPNPCGQNPPSAAIPHFDVMHRLEQLPLHWLKVGCHQDVDLCACYKAKCGDTCVWVNPPDLKSLSDFTLVILDIATRDPASLAIAKPTAQVVVCNHLEQQNSCNLGPTNPLCNCKDCVCTFDPVPAHNSSDKAGAPYVHDCTMNIASCAEVPMTGPGVQVVESWNIYQHDSTPCKDPALDCEPPQFSCSDYIIYSGKFVTNLPYVCKQRGAGRPCPPMGLDKLKMTNPLMTIESLPSAERPRVEQEDALSQTPFVVPQFQPPAAYGSHAAPPSYSPNR